MTTRWGILGCGDVCEVKSGPALQRAKGSSLVAVMRRDGALAADFAQRHGVETWYDDADRLISDSRVDAVYIASPPGTHLDLALRVAAAGKPAYVEKPMARNHSECERMVAAFAEAKLPLFVAYYRRALPRFLKIKEILESGALGTVTSVNCRCTTSAHQRLGSGELPWRVRAEHAGAGIFLDLASHMLDLLDFLLGPLGDVQGSAANIASPYDVEDTVSLQFRTPSGVIGTGLWNFASALEEDLIAIAGTEGEVRFQTFGQAPVELRIGNELTTLDLPNPRHIQEPLIQTIVDSLAGRGVCPSTGVSGARASAVMDQALLSYYGTRADGFWREPARWPGRRTAT